MFWPFPPMQLALPTILPDGQPRHMLFPGTGVHPSWTELALYLGREFRPEWANGQDAGILAERQQYASDAEFYQHSQRYLYHLTSYFLEGWKRPGYVWLWLIASFCKDIRVLDYGCGIGADGIYFLDGGLKVGFADFDNPCLRYLRWRLAHRMWFEPHVYALPQAEIPAYDVVWCMDVLEHIPPADQRALLDRLTALAPIVILNAVDDKDADSHVHYPVDVDAVTSYFSQRGGCVFRDGTPQPDGSVVRFVLAGRGTLPNGLNIWGIP